TRRRIRRRENTSRSPLAREDDKHYPNSSFPLPFIQDIMGCKLSRGPVPELHNLRIMVTCTTTKADHGCQQMIKDFRIENAHIYSDALVEHRDGWGKHLVEPISKKEAEKLAGKEAEKGAEKAAEKGAEKAAEKGAENDRPPLFEVKVGLCAGTGGESWAQGVILQHAMTAKSEVWVGPRSLDLGVLMDDIAGGNPTLEPVKEDDPRVEELTKSEKPGP
ncbi:hypothetical protein B0H65DRAFT_572324, partial [Neurospora tetraspora]